MEGNPVMLFDPDGRGAIGPGDPNNEFGNDIYVGPDVDVVRPAPLGPVEGPQTAMPFIGPQEAPLNNDGSDFSGNSNPQDKTQDAQSGGVGFLDYAGGLYEVIETIGDSKLNSGNYKQLNGKTGNFNDRPHKQLSEWAKTNKAYAQNLSTAGKWGGRGVVAVTVVEGGVQMYNGYQKDGGQFGYNAQVATGSTVGSLFGGWAGAEAGAWSFGIAGGLIGGPPGAFIGAVIGGFAGGWGGGYLGGNVGGGAVNYYHRR